MVCCVLVNLVVVFCVRMIWLWGIGFCVMLWLLLCSRGCRMFGLGVFLILMLVLFCLLVVLLLLVFIIVILFMCLFGWVWC